MTARVEIHGDHLIASGLDALPAIDKAIVRASVAHDDAGLSVCWGEMFYGGTIVTGCNILLTADVLVASLGETVPVTLTGWPSRLRHAGCGAVMDGEAWRAQPSITAIKEVFGAPMRPCLGCGSHVSAGQMQAVTGD